VSVKDSDYTGWEDSSVVNSPSTVKEFRLIVGGIATECIKHNSLATEMKSFIDAVLDIGIGGSVCVEHTRSKHLAKMDSFII
jgi:hypothetical protein